ncbi:lycopene cyclase domain-containing protein [Frigoribacterium sp. PhB107]|uniref:lycopene cyclase domain-containing protein n=1 Tax=Frigoribacterium sp. PhB107 TaxID=2485172 RepID=UPI000F497188|nr:lycopene cyclase domain-containing protein [Frigoribacterium sp. PhB107]ROP73538.1 lycopene cyclase domain-containing protein [Frigoribacterium sp. PhB107]
MTYWAINAVFLGLVAVTAGAALLLRWARTRSTRASSTHGSLAAVVRAAGLSTAVLLVMTAVFDNVMIGVGLVGYDESRISGAFVGIAPLEDFAYAVAALVLLPSVWTLLGSRSETEAAKAAGESRRAGSGSVSGPDASTADAEEAR